MVCVQVGPVVIGQHVFDLGSKAVPLLRTQKNVHKERAAAGGEAFLESSNFLVCQRHVTGMLEVEQGIIEDLGVGELYYTAFRIGADRGELLKTVRDIQIRIGIVHPPTQPALEIPRSA